MDASRARSRRLLATLAAVALFPLLAGCEDGATATAPDGDATLSVRLTDADGPVESVWIDVTELRLSGGPDEAAPSEGGGGGVTLLSDAEDDDPSNDGSSDLLELSPDEVHDLVSGATVPAGIYGQLRLVIGAAVLETADGLYLKGDPDLSALPPEIAAKPEAGTLRCPSCSQSGLKITPPGGALELESGSSTLVLDFDVPESFAHPAGNSGAWVMRPVIVASRLEAAGTVSGTVATAGGVSLPACGGGAPTVADFLPELRSVDDPETVKSGTVAEDGSYEIAFVPSGDWTATYADSVEVDGGAFLRFDATASPTEVTIEPDADATVDYTITSATCSE